MSTTIEQCKKQLISAQSQYDKLHEQDLIMDNVIPELFRLAQRDINRMETVPEFERDFRKRMTEISEQLKNASRIHSDALKMIKASERLIRRYEAQSDPFMDRELRQATNIIERLRELIDARVKIDRYEYQKLIDRLTTLSKVMRVNLKFISS